MGTRVHARLDPAGIWTKIPVIVDGHRPATLRAAQGDRGRVGLTYGPSPGRPAGATAASAALRWRRDSFASSRAAIDRRRRGPAGWSSRIGDR